jgi:hypothetical protein
MSYVCQVCDTVQHPAITPYRQKKTGQKVAPLAGSDLSFIQSAD